MASVLITAFSQPSIRLAERNHAFMLASGVENANHWLGATTCSRLLQKFRLVRPAADLWKKHRMADSAVCLACCRLLCSIVAWSPASYENELGVFDFALAALPNERKTTTNGGTLAPALSMKALVS